MRYKLDNHGAGQLARNLTPNNARWLAEDRPNIMDATIASDDYEVIWMNVVNGFTGGAEFVACDEQYGVKRGDISELKRMWWNMPGGRAEMARHGDSFVLTVAGDAHPLLVQCLEYSRAQRLADVPVRYEFAPATGLQVQRRDSDIVDCDVAGYGPGTDLADARKYVDSVCGALREFAYPAK